MSARQRLKNKVALITGAARGIGAAIARLFVEEGATVVISDILDDAGLKTIDEIGGNVFYYHLDVRYEEGWQAVTKAIIEKFHCLDVLVNNARVTGFNTPGAFYDPEHISLENWREAHDVNLNGIMLGCKYAIQLMKKKGGAIINIAARSDINGGPHISTLTSSKAVKNHTRSVELYCAEMGYPIRCNSIRPEAVHVPLWNDLVGTGKERERVITEIAKMIPIGRGGEPLDVAYAALYLASDESKYTTGTEIRINGECGVKS